MANRAKLGFTLLFPLTLLLASAGCVDKAKQQAEEESMRQLRRAEERADKAEDAYLEALKESIKGPDRVEVEIKQ